MQNSPTKLATERMGEIDFRRIAGLCIECGVANAERGTEFCEVCRLATEIPAMETEWRTWGIAA